MSDRNITLQRRNVVARILSERGETLVVTGLGSTTWDVAAAGDHSGNFYLWGGMGGAAMTGLGLALAQPERRVLVITGDGEMLMAIGSHNYLQNFEKMLFNMEVHDVIGY